MALFRYWKRNLSASMYHTRLTLYIIYHTPSSLPMPLFDPFRVLCFDKLSVFISSEEALSPGEPALQHPPALN